MAEENKCEYYYSLHDDTLKRHDHEIRDIKSELSDLKLSQTEVNTKFVTFMESMSKLPEILESIKEANIGTGFEIRSMKQDIEEIKDSQSKNDDRMTVKVNKIEEDVKTVDNKDKISILEFVKNNIWKILGVLVVVGYATYMAIK